MPMGMEHRLEPRLEQQLRLSPRIIQSIEILQLPLLALEGRVEQELVENPVLELREEGPPESDESQAGETSAEETPAVAGEQVAAPTEERTSAEADGQETEYDRLEDLVNDWEDFHSQTRRVTSTSDEVDPKAEAIQNTVERSVSLDEYLLGQLRLLSLKPAIRSLAEAVISSLDGDGFLRTSLEDLLASRLDPQADDAGRQELLRQAEEALQVVQSLEPPGVAARSLAECLLLQVTDNLPQADLLRDLLQHHFQDLLQNRLPAVAKAIGRSVEDISQALKTMAQLNPRPGSLFTHELVPGVIPDLTVRYEEGRYRVQANDARVPNLYIRREYRELLRRRDIDPKLRDYVREKVRAAQWLMEAIEQRRLTVTRIAQAIVDHQTEFMEKGESRLRPLKMQDVAQKVGVHVATVSRAVSGKYLDTPLGIYELRHFFTGGLVTAAGTEASYDAVKQHVLQLVGEESKEKPLSDQAIVERLKAEGIEVARRTITKYRQELNIPPARLRRQYTSKASS
jgi:RNA polymerase sigma-54 factor